MSLATETERLDRATHLNLGCGADYRDGDEWFNVDVSDVVNPDFVLDLSQRRWPFEDGSFRFVLAKHVFEHLGPRELVNAFAECGRLLQPGGALKVQVPLGTDADTDPTHANTWTWMTPEYFARDGPYHWEAGQAFELVAKDVDVWCDGPGALSRPSERALNLALAVFGPWKTIGDWPFMSGVLTAVYWRVDE